MDQNSYLPVPDSRMPDTNSGALPSVQDAGTVSRAVPDNAPPFSAQAAPIAPQASGNPQVAPSIDPFAVTPKLVQQLSSVPPEANDVDVIEKEWVNHLKEITNRTADNPFIQQQEISRAKADYLKKRYNKDIKVSEGN